MSVKIPANFNGIEFRQLEFQHKLRNKMGQIFIHGKVFSLFVVASAVGAHLMCLSKFTTFLFHKCVMLLIFMSQPCYKPFI